MPRFAAATAAAFLVFVGAARLAAAQDAPLLTIDDAVALALQQNRSIRAAALDVDKAGDAIGALRARRFPAFEVDFLEGRLLGDFNLRFPAGAFGTFPATGPVPGSDMTISTPAQWTSTALVRVTQPLTALHRIAIGEQQLTIGRRQASERLRGARQTVANQVQRLYYGILQADGGLAAAEQSLAMHQEVARLVAERVQEGTSLQADALDVQAAIAKQQAQITELRDTSASLHEQLNAVLGRDIATPFSVAPVPPAAPGTETLTDLETRALGQRPDVREARLAVDQAEADVKLKHAAFIPEVSATVNFLSFSRIQVLPRAAAVAGVLATWEPFDWGRKRHDLAASEKTVEQAKAALADAEARARTEVRSRYRALSEARALVQAADLGAQAARERLRLTTNLYREQKALLEDVLQKQTALAAADQEHTGALARLGTARADLEQALGDPLGDR
ncbi:MAG TPA: TolC family protein [Vicinamibacterales bacterium]|nr:TolC family protein [Vicinamibacterales bacterium]